MSPSDFGTLQQGHEDLKKQVAGLNSAVTVMRLELKANTEVTGEIREVLVAAKTGFKVLGWLGTALKWALGIGTAVLAFVAAWHQAHK